MMQVQQYLKDHGLAKLQEEYKIEVRDYPDRVVLNYSQIDSPRFHPICDECRALILRKDTWDVLARSFDRFFNIGEGDEWKRHDISKARIDEKLDGSIMSVYWDGDKWCVSTRKMGYAEGTNIFGKSFRQLFDEAAVKTELWKFLDSASQFKQFTWVFELTSQENRIVTRYSETSITLIGARHNLFGGELNGKELDDAAKEIKVARPKSFKFTNLEDTIKATRELDTLDEGFVLVWENDRGESSYRLKCKNERYVAIAHMRENGQISPKNILAMIMANETSEYIGYFPEDEPYISFVEPIYKDSYNRIIEINNKHMTIKDQKEFALTIMPLCKYGFEKGTLFAMRKGGDFDTLLLELGAKKIAKELKLKERFAKEFNVQVDDEE